MTDLKLSSNTIKLLTEPKSAVTVSNIPQVSQPVTQVTAPVQVATPTVTHSVPQQVPVANPVSTETFKIQAAVATGQDITMLGLSLNKKYLYLLALVAALVGLYLLWRWNNNKTNNVETVPTTVNPNLVPVQDVRLQQQLLQESMNQQQLLQESMNQPQVPQQNPTQFVTQQVRPVEPELQNMKSDHNPHNEQTDLEKMKQLQLLQEKVKQKRLELQQLQNSNYIEVDEVDRQFAEQTKINSTN